MNLLQSVFLVVAILAFSTSSHAANAPPPTGEEPKVQPSSFFYYPQDQAFFEYLEKRYRRPDNSLLPFGNYFQFEKSKPSKKATEYSKGFREGLGYFSSAMTWDSSGSDTEKFYKKVSRRSKAYQLGVDVAFHIRSLYMFEAEQASLGRSPQGNTIGPPPSEKAHRMTLEEMKQLDERDLTASEQKEMIEIIGKKYLRQDGKHYPQGNNDTSRYRYAAEANEAFNDGMKHFLFSMPGDSTGVVTKKFFENCGSRSAGYQVFIAVAYEIYARHRFEVKEATVAKLTNQTANLELARAGR